jgi:hypothetical protein
MDADAALAELVELSSQVREAAIVDGDGSVLAATARGAALAPLVAELVDAASTVRPGAEPSRVEVALPEGSLILVRESGRSAVATTVPEPTAGLAVYDLRTCLRRLEADG